MRCFSENRVSTKGGGRIFPGVALSMQTGVNQKSFGTIIVCRTGLSESIKVIQLGGYPNGRMALAFLTGIGNSA